MLQRICQNLTTVISEILETMFFVFPESLPFEAVPACSGLVASHVRITGPEFDCRLEFLAQSEFLNQVAMDFLGLEDASPDPAQCHDVLKEISNMVAGNLVNISDPEATLALGIPEMAGTDIESAALEGCQGRFAFQDDSGYLLVGVRDLRAAG